MENGRGGWTHYEHLFDDHSDEQIATMTGKTLDAVRLKRVRLSEEIPTERPSVQMIPASQDGFVGFTSAAFDIETTFSKWPRVLCAASIDSWGTVTEFRLDDPVHKGKSWLDDSVLVDNLARHLETFDVVYHWYGSMFDLPVLNGRLLRNGMRPVDLKMSLDLCFKAGGKSMKAGSRSLANMSEYFASPNRKTPLDPRVWDEAGIGDQEAYDLVVEHCVADVRVTRDLFAYLKPLVRILHRSS